MAAGLLLCFYVTINRQDSDSYMYRAIDLSPAHYFPSRQRHFATSNIEQRSRVKACTHLPPPPPPPRGARGALLS